MCCRAPPPNLRLKHPKRRSDEFSKLHKRRDFALFRPGQPRSSKDSPAAPTRADVSASQWEELLQLVQTGEISEVVARQIESDMFEPRSAGQPPMLNDEAWLRHLDEQSASLERAIFKGTRT